MGSSARIVTAKRFSGAAILVLNVDTGRNSVLQGAGGTWHALVVSPGAGFEAERNHVRCKLEVLGFEASVWDQPGYPVTAGVDPYEACVDAIHQHDFVVALLGTDMGSPMTLERLRPALRATLEDQAVISRNDDVPPPSVLQAEIRIAQALNIPVITLVPDELLTLANAAISRLADRRLQAKLRARRVGVEAATELIRRGDWWQLHLDYNVPGDQDISYQTAAFIRDLSENLWCHFYRRGELSTIDAYLVERLRTLPLPSKRKQVGAIDKRLGRKRDPFNPLSLGDLRSLDLLVQPPFELLSGAGQVQQLMPLLPDSGRIGLLADALDSESNVLILGEPGVGKSSCSLVAAFAAAQNEAVDATVLVAMLRSLPNKPIQADDLLRILLGTVNSKTDWPAQAPLPKRRCRIVLDGVDELRISATSSRNLLLGLAERHTLLASCRETEWTRALHVCADVFDIIIRLTAWGAAERLSYIAGLRRQKRFVAANFIERQLDREEEFLAIPIWLSSAAFAAERNLVHDDDRVTDYQILIACSEALAVEECRHAGIPDDQAPELRRVWRQAAWEHNRLRREGKPAFVLDVFAPTGLTPDSELWVPAISQMEIVDERVIGFLHEVVGDYWLAQHIAVSMIGVNPDPNMIARMLAVARSPLANRLVRHGIAFAGKGEAAASALMAAFSLIADTWTKNQLLYLIGRIDRSDRTLAFLQAAWRDSHEDLFVRYSAAYAGATAGDPVIEREFYADLITEGDLDTLNLAYHRIYWGDCSWPSSGVPSGDDGGPADYAIMALVRRLSSDELHHRKLRRIELFTLVRFGTTRGRFTSATVSSISVLLQAGLSSERDQHDDVQSLTVALNRLLDRSTST